MSTLPEGASGAPSDADLIRRELETLGLSQREAARQLAIDDRSMRYYCSGKLPVPPTIFLALRQLAEIQENDQTLALLEDGTMSTSDGPLTAERLREANRTRRAVVDVYMQDLRTPPDPPVLPLPDVLEEAYQNADEGNQPISEIQLAGTLGQAVDGLGRELTQPEKYGAFAVIEGLRFVSRRSYGSPVWEMHWQPLSTAIDHKGVAHHSPPIKAVGDDTIREWSHRARASTHPVLRARYADLAWEIAKYRITAARKDVPSPKPIRPNADDARRAIDAYLEAVARNLPHDVFDAWWYLGRAVELAATIRDTDRLQRAKAAVFEYQSTCERSDPAYPFWLFDDIAWEQRDALTLTTDDKATVTAVLERALTLRANQSNAQLFDPYTAQDASDRLGRWRQLLGQKTDAQRAANVAGRAFEVAADQADGLTAISLLERQAVRYRDAGDDVSAARVEQAIRRKASDAENELKRVETRYEIPKVELDSWADRVAGATFEEGLSGLVGANLVRRGLAENSVRNLAEKAVLLTHIPIKIMRHDGFASAEFGSVKDDLDGRTVHHAANIFGYSAPFLNVAFKRFREKHDVNLDRLLSAFDQHPLFPAERRELVRQGLAAWFTEDWIKATHILVPQIEAVLRDLLAALGGAVMKPDRNYGGFQSIGLGEMLNHDILRAQIPEDVRFHLRVLLQDSRGINLRNEIAHGLATQNRFGRGIANWVVHASIMLSLIRLKREPGSAQAADA